MATQVKLKQNPDDVTVSGETSSGKGHKGKFPFFGSKKDPVVPESEPIVPSSSENPDTSKKKARFAKLNFTQLGEKIKGVFEKAHRPEAEPDQENVSRWKAFMSSKPVQAIKNGVSDFGKGIAGSFVGGVTAMHDSFAERHGLEKWRKITEFADEQILQAADELRGEDVALAQALQTVHDAGYVTAGGKDVMRQYDMGDELAKNGFGVEMKSELENVTTPNDKMTVKVVVTSYNGVPVQDTKPVESETDKAVSGVADRIRQSLGESAAKGQDALSEDVIRNAAGAAYYLEQLATQMEQMKDVPQSVKSLFEGKQWDAIKKAINDPESRIDARAEQISQIGKPEAVTQPAPEPTATTTASAPVKEESVHPVTKPAASPQPKSRHEEAVATAINFDVDIDDSDIPDDVF